MSAETSVYVRPSVREEMSAFSLAHYLAAEVTARIQLPIGPRRT